MTTSPPPPPIQVVLDIGSSSVRGCVWCGMRFMGTIARERLQLHKDGTFSADETYAAITCCARDALDFAARLPGAAASTISVSVSVFACSWMGVDDHGAPLTPIYCYAFNGGNTRSVVEALKLECVDYSEFYDRVGAPLHPAYAATILRSTGPWPHVARWTSLTSWLAARWASVNLSEVGISLADCAWAGLLNWSSGAYDDEALAIAGLAPAEMLSIQRETFSVDCILTDGSPLHSSSSGNVTNLRIQLGLGDGAAATAASSAPWPSQTTVAITIGTSAAVRVILPLDVVQASLCSCGRTRASTTIVSSPTNALVAAGATLASQPQQRPHEPIPRDACCCPHCGGLMLHALGLWCYRVSSTECLLGGSMTDGGSAIALLSRSFETQSDARSDDCGTCPTQQPLTPSPVLCLPFWSGERSPGYNSAARACFVGLDAGNTTPAALQQAAMEGVCYHLRLLTERVMRVLAHSERRKHTGIIPALLPPQSHVIVALSGGACIHHPQLPRLLAAVLGRDVYLQEAPATSESAGAMASGPTVLLPSLCGNESESFASSAADESPPGDTIPAVFALNVPVSPPEVTSLGMHVRMFPESCASVRPGLLIPTPSPEEVAQFERGFRAFTLLYNALEPLHGSLEALLRRDM